MEFYSKCFPIIDFLRCSIKVREEQKAPCRVGSGLSVQLLTSRGKSRTDPRPVSSC